MSLFPGPSGWIRQPATPETAIRNYVKEMFGDKAAQSARISSTSKEGKYVVDFTDTEGKNHKYTVSFGANGTVVILRVDRPVCGDDILTMADRY